MKPGLLTTEFAGAMGVAAALCWLALDAATPEMVRSAACIGAALASWGYARSRAAVKATPKPIAESPTKEV